MIKNQERREAEGGGGVAILYKEEKVTGSTIF